MADRGETAAWVVPAGVLGAIRVTCGPAGVTALTFLAEAAEAPDPAAQRDFARAHPWAVALLDGLRDYLAGRPVDFAEIPVDLSGQTPFRRRVQEACRRIPYGRTSSYAELAVAVGQPAAARAVGGAMRHNPVALIVPCHRVLNRDGRLGGFSAAAGVLLKKQLLDLERGPGRC